MLAAFSTLKLLKDDEKIKNELGIITIINIIGSITYLSSDSLIISPARAVRLE